MRERERERESMVQFEKYISVGKRKERAARSGRFLREPSFLFKIFRRRDPFINFPEPNVDVERLFPDAFSPGAGCASAPACISVLRETARSIDGYISLALVWCNARKRRRC